MSEIRDFPTENHVGVVWTRMFCDYIIRDGVDPAVARYICFGEPIKEISP